MSPNLSRDVNTSYKAPLGEHTSAYIYIYIYTGEKVEDTETAKACAKTSFRRATTTIGDKQAGTLDTQQEECVE